MTASLSGGCLHGELHHSPGRRPCGANVGRNRASAYIHRPASGRNGLYDAQNDEYGDLYEKGIIDPAKVVRAALQDAASIAGLMITTEAGVAEAPKKKGAGHSGCRSLGRSENLLGWGLDSRDNSVPFIEMRERCVQETYKK